MKKLFSIFVLMTLMLIILAGCTPNSVVQITTPVPGSKSETPAPDGQIDVPGVSIKINVPGENPLVNKPDSNGRVDGILLGIWHGVISPFTLIASFINSKYQMYEVHNDGSPYNFGFLVGVAIVFLLLGIFGGSRRR